MIALLALLFAWPACAAPASAAGAVFALPVDPEIDLQWVLQPLDAKLKSAAGSHRFRFAVDAAGNIWLAEGSKSLMLDPIGGRSVRTRAPFNDSVWLDGDALVCGRKALSVLALPKGRAGKLPPQAVAVPLAALPSEGCRLFAAGPESLYLLQRDPAGDKDAIFIARAGNGGAQIEKLVEADFAVSALAGDGAVTFVAGKNRIFKLSPESPAPQLWFEAKDDVTGLAYSQKAGLFYATKTGVGFADPKFQLEFLKASEPQIALHGADLFIELGDSFGILKVTGADRFKTFRWPGGKTDAP